MATAGAGGGGGAGAVAGAGAGVGGAGAGAGADEPREFQVRVVVHEARQLKGKDRTGFSDPVVFVKCLGRQQQTAIIKQTLTPYWEHTFFFEGRMTLEEFSRQRVTFSVFDANTFQRNELIGSYAVELGRAHNAPAHEVWRQWVGLTDPKAGPALQGFLRVSVVALASGETAKSHEDDEDDEAVGGTDLQKMVLMPPELQLQGYRLCIRLYKADGLPKTDALGTCDPFVRVEFSGQKLETPVIKNTLAPTWNYELRLPFYMPCLSDTITISVYDWNMVAAEELISSVYRSLQQCINDEIPPAWANLYGAPRKTVRDSLGTAFKRIVEAMLDMNRGKIPPTAWKGRLLNSMLCERDPEPRLGQRMISPCADPPNVSYLLRFDLYSGSELRVKGLDRSRVVLRMGPYVLKSKAVAPKGSRVDFYQQFVDTRMALPADVHQLPDIIIDVEASAPLLGKSRFGYLRFKAEDVLGFRGRPRWHPILPDKTSEMYEEGLVAGFLLMNVQLGLESELPRSVRLPLAKPHTRPYQIRAHIYQARGLAAADSTGTSDPFVVIMMGSSRAETDVRLETLCPKWYQTRSIDVDIPEDQPFLAQDLIVQVWDKDVGLDGNDLIGRCEIPISQMTRRFNPSPTWIPLYMESRDNREGELLASFQLIPIEQSRVERPPMIAPPAVPAVVQLTVVGLRGLVPPGILAIHSPFITFDVGEVAYRKGTMPCSTPSPVNPNHLQVLHVKANLPVNRLYAPSVNVRVYDKPVIGTKPILLGTATIDLAPYYNFEGVQTDPPRHNLPLEAGVIPGAVDEEPQPVPQYDPMKEAIPADVTDANAQAEEILEFNSGPTGSRGIRTIPDVAEQEPGFAPQGEEVQEVQQPIVQRELEFELHDQPFDEFPVWRGQKYGLSWLDRLLNRKRGGDTKQQVGKLKAQVSVRREPVFETEEGLTAQLRAEFAPVDYEVRVYVLRARQLVPKDSNGKSDPYMVVYTDPSPKHTCNDVAHYQKATLRPDFFICYPIPATLPGHSDLTVEVWDHNVMGRDEMIGRTVIDLENRIFCPSWTRMDPKPVEHRTLWSPSSSCPQGKVELFVEVLSVREAELNPIRDIRPPLPEPFEMRLIVWNTAEVAFKDRLTDRRPEDVPLKERAKEACSDLCACCCSKPKPKSDIFVSGAFGREPQQKTDVHWNSEDGRGMFNWRMRFPMVLPLPEGVPPRLQVQIWDANIVNPNESIAEAVLNLRTYLKTCQLRRTRQELERQWITMTHPNYKGPQGKLELSIEVMPKFEADTMPAGLGREMPNQNPVLPKPERPESSFNPWRVDKQISFFMRRNKLVIGIIIAVVVLLIAALIAIVVKFYF